MTWKPIPQVPLLPWLRRNPVLGPLAVFLGLLLLIALLQTNLAKPKIGVIYLEGMLLDAEDLLDQVQALREDDQVKGVILRINSPGGAVAPFQELYQELALLAEEKPLYASISTVAASGGYYAAIAAERIYALPGSLTGSIGVILQTFNAEEAANKLGLRFEVIKAGQNKDIGNSFRQMTPEERLLLESMLKETHRQFLADVQSRRHLPEASLALVSDGRVVNGSQALALGMIDELAGFRQVQEALADKLNLEEFELFEAIDPQEKFFRGLESLLPLGVFHPSGLYFRSELNLD